MRFPMLPVTRLCLRQTIRFESTGKEVVKDPVKLRKTYKLMKQVRAGDDVLAERQFLHMRVSKIVISGSVAITSAYFLLQFYIICTVIDLLVQLQ